MLGIFSNAESQRSTLLIAVICARMLHNLLLRLLQENYGLYLSIYSLSPEKVIYFSEFICSFVFFFSLFLRL